MRAIFPTASEALASGVVDYVAMDIKAPLEKYSLVTNIPVETDRILESIRLIIDSGIPHEFRSTLVKGIHTPDDIVNMAQLVEGADAYFLQRFRPTEKLINASFKEKTAPSEALLKDLALQCAKYVKKCELRAAA